MKDVVQEFLDTLTSEEANWRFAYWPVRLTDVHGTRYWTVWTSYWLGADGVKYHCRLCDPVENEAL